MSVVTPLYHLTIGNKLELFQIMLPILTKDSCLNSLFLVQNLYFCAKKCGCSLILTKEYCNGLWEEQDIFPLCQPIYPVLIVLYVFVMMFTGIFTKWLLTHKGNLCCFNHLWLTRLGHTQWILHKSKREKNIWCSHGFLEWAIHSYLPGGSNEEEAKAKNLENAKSICTKNKI